MSNTAPTAHNEILTTKEAAAFLRIHYATFMNKKSLGDFDGLRSYQLPNTRGHRYLRSDIIQWLVSCNEPKPKLGRPRKQG